MITYSVGKRQTRLPRRLIAVLAIFVVCVAVGALGAQRWYQANVQPVSSSTQKQYITVSSGETLTQIAKQLADAKLIRSDQAFIWYVSLRNARNKLQAGTYSFTPSESASAIAQAIIRGKVATDLVTILPGQRLDQIREAFIGSGFKAADVDAALEPSQYRNAYPVLAGSPPTASLEGFLYPDSYQKNADTDPRQIVGEALDEMQAHLTADIRSGFAAHNLTVFQGVTLASIVEQEVPSQNDRNQAAQVFLKRLSIGMELGSDVTAYYGAIHDGLSPSLDYDSPYNTLKHTGLPPGPISNVSESSLEAIAYPAGTDWLYFVAGDDGVTHFAKTLDEHNANVSKYCHTLCSAAP